MPKSVKKKILKKKPVKKTTKKVVKKVAKKSIKKISKPKKLIKKTRKVAKKVVKKNAKKKVQVKSKLKKSGVQLTRSLHNPIITPSSYPWESKATFNPTAFEADGKIYIIYRAIGDTDNSVLGYASSKNGFHVSERYSHFIYKREGDFVKAGPQLLNYSSGGGWGGGCEDPRITRIGETLFMIYTAFDGWGSLRMALTSIKVEDFTHKRWNWKKPVLISPPGQIHKNWVIFPEKINGKYAILHSFYPHILVDYFDSLDELDGHKFIHSNNTRPIDPTRDWDSWFRGVGPAPIKIKEGWLIIYHAMDHKNPDRYRMGAVILDAKDPTKILYRSNQPILEPEEYYEHEGFKWGVVYSCGAVVKDGRLIVYYGGADKVVCVASIMLQKLVDGLKKGGMIKLERNKLLKSV